MTNIPFPNKKYDVIYCDPPWKYATDMHNTKASTGGAHDQYPCMPVEDIMALPVKDIAAKDCCLFMWFGSPLLIDALRVGNAWGFRYVTIAYVWEKQITNPGHHTMSSCEMVLLFKNGKTPKGKASNNERQFWSIKRGVHSAKPLQIKDSIARMYPTHAKIELFARRLGLFAEVDDGWDYWGNQVV